MMKKIFILLSVATIILVQSCSDVRRNPGTIYMPDMAYSRAYETYADHSNLDKEGIFYNNMPVAGTIARGEEMPFLLAKDVAGDTTNYFASKMVQNPLPALDSSDMKESERLFLVNCAICHGVALNGNGPLYKDGNGPFPAKPAALVGDAKYAGMPDGQMYYSIMYGKNLMGSYASQLSRKQRWMIIHYIKSKQAEAAAANAPAKDSTTTVKK
jgi:mono/diheme cytochrome c family protein